MTHPTPENGRTAAAAREVIASVEKDFAKAEDLAASSPEDAFHLRLYGEYTYERWFGDIASLPIETVDDMAAVLCALGAHVDYLSGNLSTSPARSAASARASAIIYGLLDTLEQKHSVDTDALGRRILSRFYPDERPRALRFREDAA